VRYNVAKFTLGEDGQNNLVFHCTIGTQSPFDGLCGDFHFVPFNREQIVWIGIHDGCLVQGTTMKKSY
jgi:hypothetical protein